MPVVQPLDEVQMPLYKDAAVIDGYELEPGVCVLPLAEEPPDDSTSEGLLALKTWSPVVVLKLHAPYRLRRSSCRSEKTNGPPVLPAPADTGKFVFVDGSVTITKGLNSNLSAFDWIGISEYTFVENCVSRIKDGFVLTSVPWTWTISQDNLARRGGVPFIEQVGAVYYAGVEPKLGYYQAIDSIDAFGSLKATWGYTVPTFYPGVFMSTDLVNGGPTPISQDIPPP